MMKNGRISRNCLPFNFLRETRTIMPGRVRSADLAATQNRKENHEGRIHFGLSKDRSHINKEDSPKKKHKSVLIWINQLVVITQAGESRKRIDNKNGKLKLIFFPNK